MCIVKRIKREKEPMDRAKIWCLMEQAIVSLESAADEQRWRSELATYQDGLSIKTSTLPLAGMGVFATRNFVSAASITEYEGLVVARDDLQEPTTHVRTLWAQRWYVDGLRLVNSRQITTPVNAPATEMIGRGLAGICNDPQGTDPSLKPLTNVEFLIVERRYRASFKQAWTGFPGLTSEQTDPYSRFIVIRALRDIQAGEELLVDYGERFWEEERKSRKRKRIAPTPVSFCYTCGLNAASNQMASDPMYKICNDEICRAQFHC